jgi:LysR family glycine cleavage system transcriptional activator
MPRDRLPSLIALRAFEVAARLESFTAAAAEIHVSQAAISRHVRQLERELGKELFLRAHRRVELTQEGRALARQLTAAMRQIQSAVAVCRESRVKRLRLSVEPAFAAQWLVPRLGAFTAVHPNIELQLETSDEIRVLGRDADIAIRYVSFGRHLRIKHATWLMNVKGTPLALRGGRRPADAAVLGKRLLHDDGGRAWRRWFSASGLEGYDGARHQFFTDYSLASAAARRGQGIVLGMDALEIRDLRARRLKAIAVTSIDLGAYWALESSDRSTRAMRVAFLQWLTQAVRDYNPGRPG